MTSDELAPLPWQPMPGTATGIGSMPGEDPVEAMRVIFGELPDLPHLAELPARGPGADMIGRAAGLLVDLHVDLQPAGWRLVDRPGMDERRAQSYLSRDLDALEEVATGYAGPLKIQLCGPWTLAASVELPRGDKALSDVGACRDLAESLAEAVQAQVADVRRRVPGALVVVQVDEPSLPAVLAGRVPTASGFDRLRAVEPVMAEEALRLVADAGGGAPVIVHCCASEPPFTLVRAAGARGASVDLSRLSPRDDEALGELVERDVLLVLGVLPGGASPPSSLDVVLEPVRRLWRRLGFVQEELADAVVLTPSCGLAGATPDGARAALARCREAAARLASG